MKIKSVNPATEEINQEFELFSSREVMNICKNSHKAFENWRRVTINKRCEYLKKLAKVLRDNQNHYAKLITIEMGKPITQSRAEIEKCAWATEFFSDNAEQWLADEIIQTEAKKSFVAHAPLGVILSIMPWNFPFWQLIRFAIPALAAGNVSILRHSNSVPMCAMAIEDMFNQAGFPDNVFRTIITEHDSVKALIKSNLINGVSVTGSVEVGKKIGVMAGKNIKKSVLELGGADPFIVLADADIDAASAAATEGRNLNSGQSCVCSKRFIVIEKIAEEFIHKFTDNMKKLKVGDPLEENTATGPLANKQQLETLENQVSTSVKFGAEINTGGKKLFSKGYFYAPTVMTAINKKMPVFKEEVFGPVAPVMIVKNEKAAIKLANDSRLGLGCSVWSIDSNKAESMARQIETGMVFINSIVRSDPRLPFGGIKESGIGRELSRYGLLEFTNTKTIVIAK